MQFCRLQHIPFANPTYMELAEAEGIEPPNLLQPADFKSVSSSIRTTSLL
jgi:hypothetical protein